MVQASFPFTHMRWFIFSVFREHYYYISKFVEGSSSKTKPQVYISWMNRAQNHTITEYYDLPSSSHKTVRFSCFVCRCIEIVTDWLIDAIDLFSAFLADLLKSELIDWLKSELIDWFMLLICFLLCSLIDWIVTDWLIDWCYRFVSCFLNRLS